MDAYQIIVDEVVDSMFKTAVAAFEQGRQLAKERMESGVFLCELKAKHARMMAGFYSGVAGDRERRLLVALHDAIQRPMGVVPDSALEFYDPQRCFSEPNTRGS